MLFIEVYIRRVRIFFFLGLICFYESGFIFFEFLFNDILLVVRLLIVSGFCKKY